MSEFEKWWKKEINVKVFSLIKNNYPDGTFTYADHTTNLGWITWQAATAESDKRIAELKQRALEESNKYVAYCDLAEAKIAELKANTSQMVQAVSRAADAREAVMENEIIALQKHINVLRENLDYAYYEVNTHFAKNIKDLLASTPAQSLQAHDNEVIEKCAKVCERRANSSWNDDRRMQAKLCMDEIRALKGK